MDKYEKKMIGSFIAIVGGVLIFLVLISHFDNVFTSPRPFSELAFALLFAGGVAVSGGLMLAYLGEELK